MFWEPHLVRLEAVARVFAYFLRVKSKESLKIGEAKASLPKAMATSKLHISLEARFLTS
jgi:hypothetical protein